MTTNRPESGASLDGASAEGENECKDMLTDMVHYPIDVWSAQTGELAAAIVCLSI